MLVEEILISSKRADYKVVFDDNLKNLQSLPENPNLIYLVDEKVWDLYSEIFFHNISPSQVILIEAIETNKDYFSLGKIIAQLATLSAKKNLTIIAIGGGIIQDISGFIASVLYRGIKWIYIPTTLLAQADSCIGAKTSINYNNSKNLLGTFWAPQEVWLSTRFIQTLETGDFYSGIGEIVKLFLIDGETSLIPFKSLSSSNEMVLRENVKSQIVNALQIKKGFIEKDEFDKGVRNILNYGHCIGHAIESATNYAIPHGQAVTLGMIWANIISTRIEILSKHNMETIFSTYLKNAHTISKELLVFNGELIISYMKMDKKREGNDLSIILMDDSNTFHRIKDLKAEIVSDTYNEFITLF